VFTDKPEGNFHFRLTAGTAVTYHEALQDFPDPSQASLYKNNKINLSLLLEVLKIMSVKELRSGLRQNALQL
jgi:hypothetical protein